MCAHAKNFPPCALVSLAERVLSVLLLVRRVAYVPLFRIASKLPSISMSLSFGVLFFLSLSAVSRLPSYRANISDVANRTGHESPGSRAFPSLDSAVRSACTHGLRRVYTSTVFTHACTHSRSYSSNSNHSSGKTLRFENGASAGDMRVEGQLRYRALSEHSRWFVLSFEEREKGKMRRKVVITYSALQKVTGILICSLIF